MIIDVNHLWHLMRNMGFDVSLFHGFIDYKSALIIICKKYPQYKCDLENKKERSKMIKKFFNDNKKYYIHDMKKKYKPYCRDVSSMSGEVEVWTIYGKTVYKVNGVEVAYLPNK